MAMATKNKTISVKDTAISLTSINEDDYISLTDMAKYKNPELTGAVITKWLSTRYTLDYIYIWEKTYNPNSNVTEFDNIRMESGVNSFVMSSKQLIERTNAIGIRATPGRYGGTYAHSDIAFEFATWISPEFKFLLVKEFQRLKAEEQERLSLDWDLQRTISKINYRIHTDAVKTYVIPPAVTKEQAGYVYASEADMLNVALFGKTATQWRKQNPGKDGNMRDDATIEQLIVLSNMESINALLIKQGMPQGDRLVQLNGVAITQMTSLVSNRHIKKLSNAAEEKKKK
ncbi:MAG: KilA-N domain-containing protein [Clostridiales Family XIII bacterium]|jgi:hypothetical protein|nr:KilA-N domain-containing protein [Clostridiales Family XIII bacterium]